MAHQLQPSETDFTFLMNLILVSYFLCSAPKLTRQWKDNKKEIRIEAVSPIKTLIKAGRIYGFEPYKKMWIYLISYGDSAPFLTQKIKQSIYSPAQ